MKVCAEYEEQIGALLAHRSLIEQGADPEEIEIRSPYPLSEHAIPPCRSHSLISRLFVRLAWLTGVVGGFSFLTFTQLEWGLTAKTGGHALVSVPINAIPMYECGMYLALVTTTLMFFVETRRYRQLVPPLEEDMPVANGYIALVLSGKTAEKAKEWLANSNARSIVSYMLPILFLGTMMSGCATQNMRYQAAIKPLEQAADLPPQRSLRQPSADEQKYLPPQPYGWLHAGDQPAFDLADKTLKEEAAKREEQVKAGTMKRPEANRANRAAEAKFAAETEEIGPELWMRKNNRVPDELAAWKNPVPNDDVSKARGDKLYQINCKQCHGPEGQGDGKVGELIGNAAKIGSKAFADRGDGELYHFIMTGKNVMPAFGYRLNTHEIGDIINHLRVLQQNAKT